MDALEHAPARPPIPAGAAGPEGDRRHQPGRRLTPRRPALALLLLAVAYPAVRVALAFTASGGPLFAVLEDDAYYYALVAENLADGVGSTFGRLTSTNGYQPLWQLLLVPLAWAADGEAFLRLLVVPGALSFAAFVLLGRRLTTRLGAPVEGCYALAYAVVLGLVFGDQFFSGMEIALVVPLATLLMLVVLDAPWYGPPSRARPVRWGLLFGAIALALTLGRLDALALPAAYGVVVAVSRGVRVVARTLAVAAAVVVPGLLVYLLVNVAQFSTPLPVSGQAKSLGGGRAGADLLVDYLVYGSFGPLPSLFLGLQATALTVVALVLLRRRAAAGRHLFPGQADDGVGDLLASLLLGQALQLAYYTATTSWEWWPWYYYYIPLQFILAGTVLVRSLTAAPSAASLRHPRAGAAVLVAAVALCLLSLLRDGAGSSWKSTGPDVGRWIASQTPEESVVGIGDRAGTVTWWSGRRTVQLEGLVEDEDYLRVLESHAVARHMTERSVDYYVRGDSVEDLALRSPVDGAAGCWSLLEPSKGQGPKSRVRVCDRDLVYESRQDDGTTWQVWRFRPELQGR